MKETTTDERAWYEMLTGLCFTGGVQNNNHTQSCHFT